MLVKESKFVRRLRRKQKWHRRTEEVPIRTAAEVAILQFKDGSTLQAVSKVVACDNECGRAALWSCGVCHAVLCDACHAGPVFQRHMARRLVAAKPIRPRLNDKIRESGKDDW